MSIMAINKAFLTQGRLSIWRVLDMKAAPPKLTIEGKLSTHRYIEELSTIETDRYKIEGVHVYREDFGSDDFNVVYTFTATGLTVKGGETNLTQREIDDKEFEIYGSTSTEAEQEIEGGENNG